MRSARRDARARVKRIEAERDRAMLAAFRAEVGAAVRSASPLLISLLAMEGMTLDAAVSLIRPQVGSPARPRLSRRPHRRSVYARLASRYLGSLHATALSQAPLHEHTFERADGGHLLVKVVDHSIELNAVVGRVHLSTCFGELRVELMDEVPEVILTGCVGLMIDEVVDHKTLRGRGWPIVDVEDGFQELSGQTLIVAMGSVAYRMPWASQPAPPG